MQCFAMIKSKYFMLVACLQNILRFDLKNVTLTFDLGQYEQ
jgi:hypothetical protein